jgi:hypothetical protein
LFVKHGTQRERVVQKGVTVLFKLDGKERVV